ncbi:unnamed protein product [Cylicostephanus goldi]|uniref:Exocyst complex component 2 n=1 Tax=Cylicostephanus goldi TaxID=71465 RepID=A0A3P7MS73_CYLGO|nr:unnamed protein product [Cylicostephanus goldi]
MLFICGTDCLQTANCKVAIVRWKTEKKIVARLGQANRGLGEVKIATKSGGRGICNVKFRVFIAQVGPLEESAVWVDETQTVPGREDFHILLDIKAVRTVAQTTEERDALGLKPTTKKLDPAFLSKMFPDGSGNIRMESFNPQWYLLEHHSETPIEELREAIENMKVAKADEAKKNEQMHKANLYSLINCVDSLAALHDELERSNKAGEFAVIKQIGSQDVLSRKDRADATRNALSVLTRFKFIFFLSKTVDDNMKKV